jgi:beta-glucosidase
MGEAMAPARRQWFEDGRLHFALGVEDTFVPQAAPGERALDEYELTEHYERFDDDFRDAAATGAKLLRWGVPWYVVNPAPGKWDWDWTDRAVDSLLDHGLTPIVDLMHYGTPQWLHEQFRSGDYARCVAQYSAAFASRYADRITGFTPLNEPMIHALFCGYQGFWPPYGASDQDFARVTVNLARGFAESQSAIADVHPKPYFVHVDAGMRFIAENDAQHVQDRAARLNELRFLVEDLVTGHVTDDHPLLSSLLHHGISDDELQWFTSHTALPDVMGVNYYPLNSTELVEDGPVHRGGFEDPRPTLDHGTDGLADVLRTWAQRYGAPVMLTETCKTTDVAGRIDWMQDSVRAVQALRRDGMDLVGYTWWPLFDMYEWTYRRGSGPRSDYLLTMGLEDLVESPQGLRRVPNAARAMFTRLVAEEENR